MGNVMAPEDNEEVTYESGASRLCNSIICAICIAPLILLASMGVLGWNEQRAVCDMRAIAQGKDEVVSVGCFSSADSDGELVLLSCDLSQQGLSPIVPQNSAFSSRLAFTGTGLEVNVEMLQCVEHKKSETQKQSTGGGTKTVTTYTYTTEWKGQRVDSGAFSKKNSDNFRQNCNTENPSWPADLPTPGTTFAPSVKVGAFTIGSDYVRKVPLTSPVYASSVPPGWSLNGDAYTTNVSPSKPEGIGSVRVSFKGTDWSSPRVTVLGQNGGGAVDRWTASDSWLCSGFSLADLRMGDVGVDVLFEQLQAESSAVTYVLRFVGFLLMWFAFSRLFGPLEVAADCIPCIGPCLGDSIATIACCVSCLPGCACALGVIGVVWVAMRPMVGVPLMLVFLCTCCGFIGFKVYSQQSKEAGGGDGGVQMVDGEVVGAGEDQA